MTTTWYLAHRDGGDGKYIEPVTVLRETASGVVVAHGASCTRGHRKTSDHEAYFKEYGEAKQWLVARAQQDMLYVQSHLASRAQEVKRLQGLPDHPAAVPSTGTTYE